MTGYTKEAPAPVASAAMALPARLVASARAARRNNGVLDTEDSWWAIRGDARLPPIA